MPYVRDIAKMPQNIISPQALTTLLAEKEGVSDGHDTSEHTSPHRTEPCLLYCLLYRLLCRLPYVVSTFPSPSF